MTYTGIDYHKRYSVACTLDEKGRRLLERRIEHNAPEAFAAYFAELGAPSEVVIEACWARSDGVGPLIVELPGEGGRSEGVRTQPATFPAGRSEGVRTQPATFPAEGWFETRF